MARHKRIELRPDLEHQWHYKLNPDGSKTLQVRPDLCLASAIDLANDMFEDDEERWCDQHMEASSHLDAHDQDVNTALPDGSEPDIVKPRAPQLQWADALSATTDILGRPGAGPRMGRPSDGLQHCHSPMP